MQAWYNFKASHFAFCWWLNDKFIDKKINNVYGIPYNIKFKLRTTGSKRIKSFLFELNTRKRYLSIFSRVQYVLRMPVCLIQSHQCVQWFHFSGWKREGMIDLYYLDGLIGFHTIFSNQTTPCGQWTWVMSPVLANWMMNGTRRMIILRWMNNNFKKRYKGDVSIFYLTRVLIKKKKNFFNGSICSCYIHTAVLFIHAIYVI